MKPLFVFPFVALTVVLLTVAVYADQYVAPPMSELVTLRQMPNYAVPNSDITTMSGAVYAGERMVIPVPYTAEKPPETPITLPEPLVRVPFLPTQDRSPPPPITGERAVTMGVYRGQSVLEPLASMLDTPAPFPRGPVEPEIIDSKLIDSSVSSDSDLDALAGLVVSGNPAHTTSSGTQSTDPLGYGVLVFATIFTTLGLIYMAFIAYDYRQRWMNSITTQNDRYIVGTFDISTEDMYGGSTSLSDSFGFSDGFGLMRRPI